tara:strand:+ start:492 stop:935 length:444 start_codon:yes stop_codon:yes gene_type:complete
MKPDNWFNLIIFISNENYIDKITPSQKGYPNIIEPVSYFVGASYPNIIGYTSFSDMGKFYFVGNTYIDPDYRGKGLYKELLSDRNKSLHDKPKITLVNPIDNTDINILKEQVTKQGGKPVYCYTQVSDIMSEGMYVKLAQLPMFIYR